MTVYQLYFASTETVGQKPGLFESLGIDWKMLLMQTVAFLALLWLLNKYVFPVLTKTIDDREQAIEESQRAAHDASKHAAEAEEKMKEMLQEARTQAADIVTTAKEQAEKLASDSDKKAKDRAERIIETAHEDITKEVERARISLHNELIDLVTLATEKVTSKALTKSVDKNEITNSIAGVSKK